MIGAQAAGREPNAKAGSPLGVALQGHAAAGETSHLTYDGQAAAAALDAATAGVAHPAMEALLARAAGIYREMGKTTFNLIAEEEAFPYALKLGMNGFKGRSDRNRFKIMDQDQQILAGKVIGVIGLSEGSCGSLRREVHNVLEVLS